MKSKTNMNNAVPATYDDADMIASCRKELTTKEGLVASLHMTASYLEGCIDKHNMNKQRAKPFRSAIKLCNFLSDEVKKDYDIYDDYFNLVERMDDDQILALYTTRIDYQAQFVNRNAPMCVGDFVNELTKLAYAISGIHKPKILLGVGSGLGPRKLMKKLAA